MDLTRRQFLELGGVAAVGAAVPVVGVEWAPRPPNLWVARVAADMPEPDIAALLLSRAAFGARPGDVENVRQTGPDQWIEEQLDYETIDDSAVENALTSSLPTLSMSAAQLFADYEKMYTELLGELRLATLYRMTFSPRLLYEVMVEFWSDHFNIYHPTNLCRYFKTVDDREVIRKHALGKFKDLLTASAQSPAMLHYLDNDVNRRNRPNENYAREIMELHTLGVAVNDYPYTEEDVKNVALCFTGWAWDRDQKSQTYGEFQYNDATHDQGPKNVLGERIAPALRDQDGYEVIRILCSHPETPRFLATKMIRRFVTDDPIGQTPDLVDRVAATYTRTDGDIKDMVSEILRSREFADSYATYGGRLSRPIDLTVRMLRASDVQPAHFDISKIRGNPFYSRLNNALTRMGHLPYWWITPDGYPDVKESWSASSVTLTRWNLGLSMAGVGSGALGRNLITGFSPVSQTPPTITTAGEFADFWIDRILHRPMADEDRDTMVAFVSGGAGPDTPLDGVAGSTQMAAVALILDSPYFQWR